MSDTILAYEDYAQDPVSALDGPTDLPYRDYVNWLHEQTQDAAAPTDPAAGTAWVATVDAGRWVAQCIRCHAGMVVTPTDPVTLCPLCPTGWAPVEFPSTQRRAFIERELLQIPGWRLSAPAREWTPTMTNLQLRERVVRALEVAATLQPGEQVRALSVGAARVWTVGEILTAANENTHISDVLDDLAGRNGPVELEDSLEVADGTGRFLRLPAGATTTRPAHGAGRARFNTTKGLPEFSDGSSWREMGAAPELTYETLNRGNQVGTGASQVSRGNHTHIPSQPAAPSVAAVTGQTDRLAVSWVAPFAGSSAITSYRVSYSLAGQNVWTEVTSSGSGTSHTLTGLSPNARYDVRVAAGNAVGVGRWSPEGSARTGDGRLFTIAAGTLCVVDRTTGAATLIGRAGGLRRPFSSGVTNALMSRLFEHGGLLYGIIETAHRLILATIDRDTGLYTETAISSASQSGGIQTGVASDGTNVYLSWAGRSGFGSLNLASGLFTSLGSSSMSELSFVGSTLYGISGRSLYTIDTSGGSSTFVGSTGATGCNGLASDGTLLYGIYGRNIYTIAVTSGSRSLVGRLTPVTSWSFYGLAFVPA